MYSATKIDDQGHVERAILHKHGDPDLVRKIHQDYARRYRDAGFEDMASELMVTDINIPVDELNKVISICDYIGCLHNKIIDNKLSLT